MRATTIKTFACLSVTLMLYLPGCRSTPSVPLATAPETEPRAVETAAPQKPVLKNPAVTVTGDGVKMVSTPFGAMKQLKDKSLKMFVSPESPTGKDSVADAPTEKQEKPGTTVQVAHHADAASNDANLDGADTSLSGDIVLNFDDADLYEVIRMMADLMEINYIIDPGLGGKVSIHTAGKLKESDLFTIFSQILQVNGLTVVKEGRLYHITRFKEAARLPILTRVGRDVSDLQPSERVIMQIIPLKYVSAEEMIKILTPFISTEGTILSHDDTNMMLLVDKASNVHKALKLVGSFDIDVLRKTYHRVFPLTYVEAEKMVDVIGKILAAYDDAEKLKYNLISITRINALLAISQDRQVFDKIDMFLKKMDIPSENAEKKIYIYSIKNGEADELASLLNSIFGEGEREGDSASGGDGKKQKDEKPEPPAQNPFIKKQPAKKAESAKTSGVAAGTGTLRAEIKITPDEKRNVLIIEAIPADYRTVKTILNRLDVVQRQVLIEVTIAEITLDGKNELGVDWAYTYGTRSPSIQPVGSSPGESFTSAVLDGSGFQYMVGQTNRWRATLKTLANDNKVNVLASPSVLALDNKEANINISEELPVASSTYDNADTNVITTNVEYRNTGLILTVTPHVNDNGIVNMDIEQEISDSAKEKVVAGKSYPSFTITSVKTSLVVKNDQTIVIGGLIQERQSDGNSGIPILRKFPLVGFLFGTDSKSFVKKELVILITPRVIVGMDDVDLVTNEFKRKIKQTNQMIDSVANLNG